MAEENLVENGLPVEAQPWARKIERFMRDEETRRQMLTRNGSQALIAAGTAVATAANAAAAQSAAVAEQRRIPATIDAVKIQVAPSTYFDSKGRPHGRVDVELEPNDLDVDGNPLIPVSYHLWGRVFFEELSLEVDDTTTLTSIGPPYQLLGSSSSTSLRADSLQVGVQYQFRVAAMSAYGISGSLSDYVVATTPATLETMATLDAPTLTSKLGSLIVAWDGLMGGALPPSQFRYAYAEVSPAGQGAWVRRGAYLLRGGGSTSISGLLVGQGYEVRLIAMDSLDEPTAPSLASTITILGVDLGNLESDVAGAIAAAEAAGASAQTAASNAITQAVGAQSAADAAASAAGTAQATANSKSTAYYATSAPTGGVYRDADLWFDTDDGNRLYVRQGAAWAPAQLGTNALTDSAINAAKLASDAVTAVKIATGAVDSTKLAAAVNTSISTAQSTATAAQTTASGAQTTASSANTAAATAQASANAAATDAATAAGIANGKGKVIIQAAEPVVADRLAQNLWIDTTGGANTPKRWNGAVWVAVTDKAATDAAAAAVAAQSAANAAQTTANSATTLANAAQAAANAAQTAANNAATAATAAQTTANGKNAVFRQTAPPAGTAYAIGDIWFDTDDGNRIYLWSGTAWTASDLGTNALGANAVTAAKIATAVTTDISNALANAATAQSAASAAQTTANGKSRAYYQISAPASGMVTGDIWFDTDDANKLYAYSGTAWVLAQDSAAAITAVNGKNRILHQTAQPSLVGNAVGDLWFDSDDGNRMYEWSGTAWVGNDFGSSAIENASIITAKIADAAITNAKILDATILTAKIGDLAVTNAKIANLAVTDAKISTLDAAKITTGFLSADRIAAGSIATNRLVVSDFTNLFDNPRFLNPLSSFLGGASIYAGAEVIPDGGRAAALPFRDHTGTTRVTVTTGDQFLIEFSAKYLAGAAVLNAGIWAINAAGGAGPGWAHWDGLNGAVTEIADLGNGWKRFRSTPFVNTQWAGVTHAQIYFQLAQFSPFGTSVLISDIEWRRRATGELIVDGAITATKIAAGSIVAGSAILADAAITSAKIADLAVTSAKISALDAGKITTGFLAAARIEAATITGTMISGGTVTAANMVAGTITAASGIIGAAAIGSAQIADAAITTAKVGDAQINNAKISALDAGKITTGFLAAARIEANTITTNKLLVGSFENLIEDGGLETNSAVAWPTLTADVTKTTTTPRTGLRALRMVSTTAAYEATRHVAAFPVEEGEQYTFGAWMRAEGASASVEGGVELNIAHGPTEASTTINTEVVDCPVLGATYVFVGGSWTAPVGARFFRPRVVVRDIVAGRIYLADDFVLFKRMTGNLIVDGAITAGKLGAESVEAGKISANAVAATNIQAGAIVAGKLAVGAVLAGNISADAVTANEILAGSIETYHLSAAFGAELDISSNAAVNIIVGQIDAVDATAAAAAADLALMNTVYRFTSTGAQISSPKSIYELSLTSSSIEIRKNGVEKAESRWESGRFLVNQLVAPDIVVGNHQIQEFGTGTVIRTL